MAIEVWVKKRELEKVCGCAIKDKHQGTVKDRKAWHAEVHGVAESDMTWWLNNNKGESTGKSKWENREIRGNIREYTDFKGVI